MNSSVMKLTKTSKVGPTLLGARGSRNFLKINIFMRKKKKKRDTMAAIAFFFLTSTSYTVHET